MSETALRMANSFLAKHAIDKHRLHETDQVFVSFMDYPVKQEWVQKVSSHISRFYNCRVIFDYNWDPIKTLIIGTSANRITAIIVIDQLLDQIKKESRGKGGVMFKNGAAFGLYEKCQEIIAERNKETGSDEVIPGTGLTIIDIETQQKTCVNDFIQSEFKHLVPSKSRGKMSAEGRAYGKGLNPNARMQGTGQKALT